jgi:hypothetical protein
MAMTTMPGDERAAAPLPHDREQRDERLVRDEEGHLWRVRELSFADARPSLIFESEVSFRRVRAYPSDWRGLGDDELYALSWRT